MRYFLVLWESYDFVILCFFSSRHNSLILQFCTIVFRIAKYSLSYVNVGIISRTMLKPSASLCLFLYLCILEFIFSYIKTYAIHKKSYMSFRLKIY